MGKLSYKTKIANRLSFGVGEGSRSAKSIDSEGLYLLVTEY